MRIKLLAATAVIATVVFIVVLRLPGLAAFAVTVISDFGQLFASAAASVCCALAARRTLGRRREWAFLSGATGAWALGQMVWTYYEVVLRTNVPFPSAADAGFLGFPVLATIGLVIWLGAQEHELAARGRDVLDGLLIAGSLFALSWVTALHTVFASASDGWLSLVLSTAYPVGDIVVATLVLLSLKSSRKGEQMTLVILVLGLGGLAFADSAYLYLVNTAQFSSAQFANSGWVLGFLLVGVAASGVGRDATTLASAPGDAATGAESWRRRWFPLVLPYLPFAAGMTALTVNVSSNARVSVVTLGLGVVLMALVLIRQFLTLVDVQRLLMALRTARAQLEHQALHDALTGLANRLLFADRLDQALIHADDRVAVLFCDLDDFKVVNDRFGHAAGDVVLTKVAKRLSVCVRTEDTVARLGGDEFAILLGDAEDAHAVADRVITALSQPITLEAGVATISVSVGIAMPSRPAVAQSPARSQPRERRLTGGKVGALAHEASSRAAVAELLLQRADAAMYRAKASGKGRSQLAEPDTTGWTTYG